MELFVKGSAIRNAELLPTGGYTPIFTRFSISPEGTGGWASLDTRTLPNGPITVRISAWNVPAGGSGGQEIVGMAPRTWNIQNPAATPAPTPVPVPAPTPAASAIRGQISGTFNGWRGDTIVQLTDGQIWQQAVFDFDVDIAIYPSVTIYPGNFGCEMGVDGFRPVPVKQLR